MIVGLGHEAQVGKDTAAAILVEHYGFRRLAFADALKAVAYDLNPMVTMRHQRLAQLVDAIGWDAAKSIGEVRQLLQRLGVAARDHLASEVWVNVVLRQIDRALREPHGRVVVTDVRFPNELEALQSYPNRTLIKLSRIGAGAGSHVSETALASARWDHVIENNGSLDELEAQLVDVLHLSDNERNGT